MELRPHDDLIVWNADGEENITKLLQPEADTRSFLLDEEVWSVITPSARVAANP